ncbi:MAG: hypothetical protein ACKVX7_16860 [Planctomycetota bacterium]
MWTIGGALKTVLAGHDGVVWSAEFSADGRRVITASFDRTARRWYVDANELLAVARRAVPRAYTPVERERFGAQLADPASP